MGALSHLRIPATRAYASAPFITDCTAGVRTELSGTVFEQWVAKTANWLEAEFDMGVRVAVQLRAHWLWPVLVAALDEIEGAIVPREDADAIIRIGPSPTETLPVIAIHEHPMALPFREALPANHYDFFRDVRSGGDVRPPGPTHDELLLQTPDLMLTGRDLLALAHAFDGPERIALRVDARGLAMPDQIAWLTVAPWASRSSLVLADGSSSITGERATIEVALPQH